jgi:hypothetical protein
VDLGHLEVEILKDSVDLDRIRPDLDKIPEDLVSPRLDKAPVGLDKVPGLEAVLGRVTLAPLDRDLQHSDSLSLNNPKLRADFLEVYLVNNSNNNLQLVLVGQLLAEVLVVPMLLLEAG